MSDSNVLDALILVRLLPPAKKPPAPKLVQDQIYPFVEESRLPGDWGSQFGHALERLDTQGDIQTRPLRLTDRGRRRALEFLGVAALPDRTDWRKLRDVYLVAKALGLPADSEAARAAVADKGKLRGIVLKQQLGLKTKEFPSITQAIDALVWRQLGKETDRPFTATNVIRHLLGHDLDEPTRLSLDQLRQQLPAKTLDLRTPDLQELRFALLRRLCQPESKTENDLNQFAADVRSAAEQAVEGRYGDRTVFINKVWDQLRREGQYSQMNMDSFKQRLVQAHRERLLSLCRADVPPDTQRDNVRQSETPYLNATFHVIEI